jgi:3-oxoacyl-[acyl-carrier-protein] synthase-1
MDQTMKKVWAVSDCIVSPLGSTTNENFLNVSHGYSAVKPVVTGTSSVKVLAGVIDEIEEVQELTVFESLCFQAVNNVVNSSSVNPGETLLILSTTKGNIDLLEKKQPDHPRLHIHATAEFIREHFQFNRQIVVSNACISGVLAIIVAKRFIESGRYENVLVVGADVMSEFIVSGFQSLLALSTEPCRPFDANRNGINLGEGAAAILLTSRPENFKDAIPVQILGGGSSNDANHISGPSRTGEELALAITEAMLEAEAGVDDIDFISAHGTATLYNDEMEAKAFNLCGLSDVPLHSLKGYYGHTLGAAGVIETIIGIQSLRKGVIIPCLGFSSPGVSRPLNVIVQRESKQLKTFLKTSSGFGGCNAALVLQKQS